jgi:hypothetical protein
MTARSAKSIPAPQSTSNFVSQANDPAQLHRGIYRLTASIGGREIVNYGRFTVTLTVQDGAWRIAEDIGTVATAEDFEELTPT